MAELVRFPDLELWMSEYLHNALALRAEPEASGVLVSKTMPAGDRRPRMVIVRDDAGPTRDVVLADARMGFNVWGESDQHVAALADLTRALVAAASGGPLRGVRRTTRPVSVEDPSRQPLRYFTAELVIRGYAA